MKALIIVPVILMSLTLFSQNDEKGYFDNGRLMFENKYDIDCDCIRAKAYFENGKLRSTHQYKNGELEGSDTVFYESGSISIYYFWKKGIPEGRIYSNNLNGNIGYEKFFKNGYKCGTWKFFDDEGRVHSEIIQEEGKIKYREKTKHGTYKTYYKGEHIRTEIFEQNVRKESTIINKALHREWKSLQPDLGEKLFKANCTACHAKDFDIVGPALKGVTERRDKKWLRQMIKDGDSLVKSGDIVAIELFQEYMISHPKYEELTDKEIDALIDYLKTFK